MLSIVWFALTAFGCVAITRSTHTTLLRGHAQFVADAVALAYVDRGSAKAEFLASSLGVTISSVNAPTRASHGKITIEVVGDGFRATSSAG